MFVLVASDASSTLSTADDLTIEDIEKTIVVVVTMITIMVVFGIMMVLAALKDRSVRRRVMVKMSSAKGKRRAAKKTQSDGAVSEEEKRKATPTEPPIGGCTKHFKLVVATFRRFGRSMRDNHGACIVWCGVV